VVTLNDDVQAIAQAVVGGGYLDRVQAGLDYFDASVNRVAAWVIGARATQKALLQALLQPWERLRAAEAAGNFTSRLAIQEEAKGLPWAAVWDYFCESRDAPLENHWLAEVEDYESNVLSKRQ
jgi:L-rhamnose isomerase